MLENSGFLPEKNLIEIMNPMEEGLYAWFTVNFLLDQFDNIEKVFIHIIFIHVIFIFIHIVGILLYYILKNEVILNIISGCWSSGKKYKNREFFRNRVFT